MSSIKLNRISTKVYGEVSICGSKSISNRILIIRELSGITHPIKNLSISDDTQRLQEYLISIRDYQKTATPVLVDAKNAGTVSRFLTAFLTIKEGSWIITGNQRMKQRPIKGLVDGLKQLGAEITYTNIAGFLPLFIKGRNISGGEIEIDVSESSQFASAIMMIGPLLKEGLKLRFREHPVSFPYIEMTSKLMMEFGANVEFNKNGINIEPKPYLFRSCKVEADWSSASYWYETAALAEDVEIKIPGLTKNSMQGDSVLIDIFTQLGVETIFDSEGIRLIKTDNVVEKFSFNFESYPDIVPAVMATCAALGINSDYKNIGHLAFKESNRIDALGQELKKIGTSLKKFNNRYRLSPNREISDNNLAFNTYGDHRIAMCLAPLVLKYNNIEICDPNVVNKSYPEFWDDFKKLKFAVSKITETQSN